MKKYLTLALSLTAILILAASLETSAQKKKTKTTFYVPVEERNFAQKLGGYSETDYRFYRCTIDFDKKKNRHLYEELVCSSYEEAIEKLPLLPDPSEIDTEEKMTAYVNKVSAYEHVFNLHNPEFRNQLNTIGDSIANARMENAKRAAKGLPYDTELHLDPNRQKYLDIMTKKMVPVYNSVSKNYTDQVSDRGLKDDGYIAFVIEDSFAATRSIFNEFAPLRKQLCQEWFASEECKKVQAIEEKLIERARAEMPKKTPDWFVEGRKEEQELVMAFNRKSCARWMQKIRPKMESSKASIKKMVVYMQEFESIRNGGEMTEDYVGLRKTSNSYVDSFYLLYYNWLVFVRYTPLIKTPPTMEGKRFVI